MITIDAGNVLLKPSHRKQVMSWLKRAIRLGQRLGDFALTLSLHRSGKFYEAQARVHDSAGDFDVRFRQHDWRHAVRNLIRALSLKLSMQRLAVN
ncbi:MAG: hypothetical protein ABSH20_02755 [Tepidisphaeraceae bacterium]|jgi:hypothetical protein